MWNWEAFFKLIALLVAAFLSSTADGIFTAINTAERPMVMDTVIRMPEYGSIRYVAPPHFKYSAQILFWTPAYGSLSNWNWWFNADNVKDTCPDLRCKFTVDKSQLNASDAILFMTYSNNNFDLRGDIPSQLPAYRLPHQRWVHFTLEPPYLEKGRENLTALNGLFNWTMNYRRDADVYASFGRIALNKLPVDRIAASMSRDYAANKTKLASWFVSHCPTDGRREDYVKALQRYIPVDVYGRCGPLQCFPPQSDECYQKLNSEYKFYLSFENILCKDYVTEKFIKALSVDVIPIVFGGADYSSFAPKGSYINALDFANPSALADHLKFLDGNAEEYNRYFDWKRGYSVKYVASPHYICELCMKLLDRDQPQKYYPDIEDWWNRQSECVAWDPAAN